jgi:nitroimidazol reductase NimA-like FMN-containing flavoprotein (pyridoxamine 5'-phosphate oxidase superfamily)
MTDLGARLNRTELDAFLHRGIVARLACLDAAGWPYNVPIWHQWDGERFWVIGARNAVWVRYLRHDPRVSLCIDEPESLTRVVCQGSARLVEGPSTSGAWTPIAEQMAVRYLGADALAGYESATNGLERWLFAIDIRRLLTWRGTGRTE